MSSAVSQTRRRRLLFVVNEAYFLLSHRSEILQAAADEFEIHVAAPADHVWAPKHFDVSALTARGVQFHPIRLSRRGQNPWRELTTLWDLFRLFRGLEPDLVHLLTIKPNLYGGLVARFLGIPAVVFAVTGMGQIYVGRSLFARVRRKATDMVLRLVMAHGNAAVVVQNTADRDQLVQRKIVLADRILVMPGAGVDLEKFREQPELPGTPLVILPGRLIWEKGVGEFAQAALQLKQEGIAARFALVGDTQPSNPRSVPAAQLEAWQAAGVVEWWGRRDDMDNVMAACHVVCLPSSYGEGVPKVILEAAAAGRPVVATDIGGCREVILENETGLLVPAGSATDLANALKKLVADPASRQAMGRRARRHAEGFFDVRQVVAKTLMLYRKLSR